MSQKAEGMNTGFCCGGHRCFPDIWEPGSLHYSALAPGSGETDSSVTHPNTNNMLSFLGILLKPSLAVVKDWRTTDCLFGVNAVCYQPMENIGASESPTKLQID